MSTNKRAVPGRDDLAEIKLRRRRENLLFTHTRVAALAAEFRSHGLSDDALELYLLQLQVEQVIADEFPDEFEDLVAEWAETEARAEHHPASSSPTCGLCVAIAHDHAARTWPRAA
ncbi:hypothetical protein [Nocardioides acrostichi]|uniref:Uncharacterized protein n=1 Tax=Nocardioides acrostichi TaxID=2784339 RepID=A0A930UZG5_9ACTN|nr:hypothetical protein [Nocardioides acrostichi]MBF4162582.1 hypothetical protein [Nocardioides acrostichi]